MIESDAQADVLASSVQPDVQLVLPTIEALGDSQGAPRIVATTSVVGDVVHRVGGDAIRLTVLMAPGSDPHSFAPSVGQLAVVAEADAVFVNGWNLEEGLISDLVSVAAGAPMVPVSAGISPRLYVHEGRSEPDPHVWHDPHLVQKWAGNVSTALSALNPAQAAFYEANRAAFERELAQLTAYGQERFEGIPDEQRVLVVDHDALEYFAEAFGFRVVGTVIPGLSTLAEPSAGDLTALIRTMESEGVCHVFSDSTARQAVAQAVVQELDGCDEVAVVALYAGSLGPPGSGADNYIGMMKANVDAIAAALEE